MAKKQKPVAITFTKKSLNALMTGCIETASSYLKRYKKTSSRHSNHVIASTLLTTTDNFNILLNKQANLNQNHTHMAWRLLVHLEAVQRVLFSRSRLKRSIRRLIVKSLGMKRWKGRHVRATLLAFDSNNRMFLHKWKLNDKLYKTDAEKQKLTTLTFKSALFPNTTITHHLKHINTQLWLNKCLMIHQLYFARHPRRTWLAIGHNHHDLLNKSNLYYHAKRHAKLVAENPDNNKVLISAIQSILLSACDLLQMIANTGKYKGFLSRQLITFLNDTLYKTHKTKKPLTVRNYKGKINSIKTDVFRLILSLKSSAILREKSKSASTTSLVIASTSISRGKTPCSIAKAKPELFTLDPTRAAAFTAALEKCSLKLDHESRRLINREISADNTTSQLTFNSSRAEKLQAVIHYLKAMCNGKTIQKVISMYQKIFERHFFNGSTLPRFKFSSSKFAPHFSKENATYLSELKAIVSLLEDYASMLQEQETSSSSAKPMRLLG